MPTDVPLQALREANPRHRPGFAAEIERYDTLRPQITSSPIPVGRPARCRTVRRRVIGISAAVALAAAAVVVALTLSAAGPSNAYAAAKKALAATTAASSGTMTTMVTRDGRDAYTLATTEWNGSDIALVNGTRGDLGPIQQLRLVGGSVYVQQMDSSWVQYAKPSDAGPMLTSMLQLAENNVAGNAAEQILRLATGLEQTTQSDGSTVYTGTIPHSTADRVGAPTDDTIMQIINSLRIGPTTPGAPDGFHGALQLHMTVGSEGFVQQVSLTYQQQNARSTSGDGTFTESVIYTRLGSTAPITTPASSTPPSAATTPATTTGVTTTSIP